MGSLCPLAKLFLNNKQKMFDIVFLGMFYSVHRLGTQPLTKGIDR